MSTQGSCFDSNRMGAGDCHGPFTFNETNNSTETNFQCPEISLFIWSWIKYYLMSKRVLEFNIYSIWIPSSLLEEEKGTNVIVVNRV